MKKLKGEGLPPLLGEGGRLSDSLTGQAPRKHCILAPLQEKGKAFLASCRPAPLSTGLSPRKPLCPQVVFLM